MDNEILDFSKTLLGALGIEIIETSKDRVIATMPVNQNTIQPYGILHGGASVALAETVASLGAEQSIDKETEFLVGQEINANHISAKRDGIVTATGTPLHTGRTTSVWEIKLTDEIGKLVCISRCTLAIRKKQYKKN